ncbi:hypothetical protein ACIA3K_17585 [Micromonospora sp. NPDC051543]|uniref:hypothetical protein n=1 Tax=Micromonospora sp. NPDC051543 TaxID=3364287 RepID=UPI0037B17054
MTVRSAQLGAMAVVVVFGLGGCSDGRTETQPPQVATRVEPSTSTAASPSAAARERPRQRLDDTEADYQALLQPYKKCMEAQGITDEKSMSGWAGGDDVPTKQRTAQEACKDHWPLPPWELDPANPQAKDFTREVVKCLKGKGVKDVEAAPDGVGVVAGGAHSDAGSIAMTGELLDDCQREVAARG